MDAVKSRVENLEVQLKIEEDLIELFYLNMRKRDNLYHPFLLYIQSGIR